MSSCITGILMKAPMKRMSRKVNGKLARVEQSDCEMKGEGCSEDEVTRYLDVRARAILRRVTAFARGIGIPICVRKTFVFSLMTDCTTECVYVS